MNSRELESLLAACAGGAWQVKPLSASSFCDTWAAAQGAHKLFVKTTQRSAPLLEAEADGLAALQATGTVRVPRVIGWWPQGGGGALALEWLDFAPQDAGFGERFGRALAALHCAAAPLGAQFGWHRGNFIGATPQRNAPHADWLAFFAGERLRAMAQRLRDPTMADAVERVIAQLPRLFDDGHVPRASLVHGDLWSGNWGMLAGGAPVVYDPAVSCSDAESELAMMELFGSPPRGFWDAYRAAAGLHAGYERRRPLYQLYHLLNHAVLFGGGYVAQALRTARALTAPRAA